MFLGSEFPCPDRRSAAPVVVRTAPTTKENPLLLGFLAALRPALARPVRAVASVLAQVTVTPSATGLPGGALAQKVLNWTSQIALWGSLASLLVGAAVWGISQHAGNGYQAGRGRNFAVAGAVGALLAGLSPTIVNTLFAG